MRGKEELNFLVPKVKEEMVDVAMRLSAKIEALFVDTRV